ncbi:fructose-bisphosphate aldolase class I [Candidatus Kaiserbacteria bacterium CG10_big_fil_rev_8_21_14_0_10_56_12]|uniref:fructose-bisphosphate aldolase n=1 Tax=Candidatus Kaiserbacteria bacterium CG10_big_fil_rev_8_21_14_0_10_56_12 TaxID=1974611 RepID=A0A2H0UAP6_9BACT|nr:MAG: fructose-bisphosphate aldolase class I [Candidatus Kaiserbacteria bacterium CG10_big_fil_rev_8_21_14_0_10_56_12]
MTDLVATARSFFEPGKGILAADESVATATTRLASYGIETGPEMRRAFRNLFCDAEGIEAYLSGVIFFSETLLEKGDDHVRFPKSLAVRGIHPGIKVDLGKEPFPESPKEMITKGLIDLSERLVSYKKAGAVFTKWRAVIRIEGDKLPSAQALHENAKRLASYAREAQMAGMVPIVEPEVLLEGTHSRKKSRAVIEETMQTLFSMLAEHSVDRASLILKTSMALSGDRTGKKDTPEEVAEDTLAALMASVPQQIAGVVFLSGGQSPDQATDNLAAITKRAQEFGAPWPLTFSYARALQEEALALWRGKEENVPAAREAFLARLQKLSAVLGQSVERMLA